jgi:hypothetical protein
LGRGYCRRLGAAGFGAAVNFRRLLQCRFVGNTNIAMIRAVAGDMAGLLFFEGRNTPQGRTHRINSANANKLTVYLPQGKLRIDPNNSVAEGPSYAAIIIYLQEKPDFHRVFSLCGHGRQ